MGKILHKVSSNVRLDKRKGEITYRISPFKEKAPSPIPFQREEPSLYKEYLRIRKRLVSFCEILAPEDFMLASPLHHQSIKWYLGYTTWFFETHVLHRFIHNHKEFSSRFEQVFSGNRREGGIIEFSRPTIEEVLSYRNYVDEAMMEVFQYEDAKEEREEIEYLVRFGLNLEGEGEEEIFSILQYAMYSNYDFHPFKERLREKTHSFTSTHVTERWVEVEGGLVNVGYGEKGFAFQEEGARHTVFLSPFKMARDLVTNGQYLEFMLDGGYERRDLWLTERKEKKHPFYWRGKGDYWESLTLYGWKKIEPLEPVSHLDFYEASAYAEWMDARLPTEFEWEVVAGMEEKEKGNFLEGGRFSPEPIKNAWATEEQGIRQLYGDVWQWTMSPFVPYPGKNKREEEYGVRRSFFKPEEFVLRGGSCFTRGETFRKTKRFHLPLNSPYFCSGIRVVKDM